jgi:hypothetical protein
MLPEPAAFTGSPCGFAASYAAGVGTLAVVAYGLRALLKVLA